MFDIFTEEIELQIKIGISNLYWYKEDLKKAWLRSGVPETLCEKLFSLKNVEGNKLSKRELMDALYKSFREADYNRRLEVSRNFVRILIEHKDFVPQNEKHRIEQAEMSALKLKSIIAEQNKEQENRESNKFRLQKNIINNYNNELLKLQDKFSSIFKLENHKRGYELEKLFNELMKISNIPVEKPFKLEGEQIDGAIKFDSHFYLIELKWLKNEVNQKDIASLYMKVEGKFEARGIFIAMNGYSNEVRESLPRGKEIKVILLDGVHLTNVITGMYTFQELLNYSISEASLKCNIYCQHNIK